MSLDSLNLYLNDVGKTPLLSAEDEKRLAYDIRAGNEALREFEQSFGRPYELSEPLGELIEQATAETDCQEDVSFYSILGKIGCLKVAEIYSKTEKALVIKTESNEQFVNANQRLVYSIAKKYPQIVGAELLDLVQAGNDGLKRAIEKFDPDKGYKFSTYAMRWIKVKIALYISQETTQIRIPRKKVDKLRAELRENDGDIAKLSAKSTEVHKKINTLSLDKPLGEGGDAVFGDVLPGKLWSPEEESSKSINQELVSKFLAELTPLRARIISMLFGIDDGVRQPPREVAKELSLSMNSLRFHRKKALAELGEIARLYMAYEDIE